MKSLAIVVPELLPVPPVQGGAVEHWVDEVSHRLLSEDNKVTIVSRPAGVKGHEGIEYIGIPWTAAESFFYKIKEKLTWKNPLRYIAKIQNVVSYGRRVSKVVKEFDIVYLHNEPNVLFMLSKQKRQKIVLHMHNDHLSSRIFRPFYRRTLAKVDIILCVSDYIRKQAVTCFPEYADRFRVILNATDPEVFKPYGDKAKQELVDIVDLKENSRYLLYVGRLSPVKGVHVLIEAFQEIHRQMPDTFLIITGSSFFGGAAKTDYEKELVSLAEPVSDAILFTGYLPHIKLKYLYSVADMVVFPSVWQEPFGLVILEAMASGSCLVASAVGGIPEVVSNGKDGVLVEPQNPKALARAVCNTFKDSKVMSQMQYEAREKIISGYRWERLIGELNLILGNLK
ncbi:glycosyltransferase family 4 protein [Cycloclasticus pugetii]|uniref:glycosyltransferase family 4 protein n=1 Tax=Cycloclasticus pugetii TaxID=34068 RepID=UPI00037870B9|nr:glycosyltransferase family 4 protein [Cycloclasticus pugetii]